MHLHESSCSRIELNNGISDRHQTTSFFNAPYVKSPRRYLFSSVMLSHEHGIAFNKMLHPQLISGELEILSSSSHMLCGMIHDFHVIETARHTQGHVRSCSSMQLHRDRF